MVMPKSCVKNYKCEDWDPEPDPVIEPEHSSMYMLELVKRQRKYNPFGSLLKWMKQGPVTH
jgi:hypothetical protein